MRPLVRLFRFAWARLRRIWKAPPPHPLGRPRAYLQPHTDGSGPVLVCGEHRYELNLITAAHLLDDLTRYIYKEVRKQTPDPSYALRGDE